MKNEEYDSYEWISGTGHSNVASGRIRWRVRSDDYHCNQRNDLGVLPHIAASKRYQYGNRLSGKLPFVATFYEFKPRGPLT